MEGSAPGRPPQQQHEINGVDEAADAAPLLSSQHGPPRASLGLETPRRRGDETGEEEEDLATARRCLYASHFLSAWGARAWEFAAGLALFFPAGGGSGSAAAGDNDDASLSLVAALGLAQQAAQALCGPYLGREVDRLPRLVAAKRAYGLQAAGTLASALFVFEARRKASKASSMSASATLLSSSPTSSSSSFSSSSFSSSSSSSPLLVYLLGSLAALFAALAAVGASGATLSVEREWTQALAKGGDGGERRRRTAKGTEGESASLRPRSSNGGGGNGGENAAETENGAEPSTSSSSSSSAMLASINATMRRIDLACLLASPGVAGVLLSRAGTEAAVAVIAVYSCCAWAPQAWLLRRAVRAAPSRLAEEEGERRGRGPRGTTMAAAAATTRAAEVEGEEKTSSSSVQSPLAAYLSADAFPSAFALALLYLTVLSFGPLATAYLNWRGLSEVELAFWRGVGAAAGISATAVYPFLRSKVGPDAAGVVGIGSQFLCLLVGCLVAFLPFSPGKSGSSGSGIGGVGSGSVGTARLLAASLALSRFGLWLFDLFASQTLQERVPQNQLGAVNGVQSALQAGLGAASFAAGLLNPKPANFWMLAAGSLGAVSLALAVCVSGQLRLRRRERREEREREARAEIAAATA